MSVDNLEWRCRLCGRSEDEIGCHPLPVRQKAHLIPNRLSGAKHRYGGVKNAFSDEEWKQFIDAHASSFGVEPVESLAPTKKILSDQTVDLCGECHEEVISEPVYLPEVLEGLAPYFRGKTRAEKVILLAEALRLGVTCLKSRSGETKPRV